MTRPLPPKADIKHLRKEAKKLFVRLHAQAPEARLADAQFILAAEYGFKSWGRLKAEVERRNADRWTARLAQQESFRPFAVEDIRAPLPSLQRVWLARREALTGDDDDGPAMSLPQIVALQFGFLLLAIAIVMAAR